MKLNAKLSTLFATLSVGVAAQAGDYYSKAPVGKDVVPVEDAISGVLSFDVNTHFISYGLDVWGAGGDWEHTLFNPSLELTFALPNDAYFVLGTWWDVNDRAPSLIGGSIQEIDVWFGIGKDFGLIDAKLLYQVWNYGGDTEDILDLVLSFDAPLNPSFTVHYRVDEGASLGDTGVFFVGGIAPGFDLGPVAVSVPVNVGFTPDSYHPGLAPGTFGGSGYGFASVGLKGSYPLPVPEQYGEWALNAGVTFYHTSDSVIPTNPQDTFLTGSIGVLIGF